jgi:predicted dehydrogenase
MIANAGHIPAWKDVPGVTVIAVADLVEQNAVDTAERHSIPKYYTDPARMLAESKPDIVSVCTPNCHHKQHALLALRNGAHVLCEKPMAVSLAEALEVFETADAVNRTVFVAQSLRFYNAIAAAKEFAASGQLGEMYFAETSVWRRRGVPTWGRFHIQADSGGGPLFDLGVHLLDATLWMLDNPKVVAASGTTYARLGGRDEGLLTSLAESGAPIGVFNPRPYRREEFDVEDMAAGFLRLENGATISLRVSWAANAPDGMGGTLVLGTDGGLWIDAALQEVKLLRNLGRYQVDVTPKLPAPEPNVPFYGHWKLTSHVARVLRGEEEPIVKRPEVLNVIGALEALYRSAAEGREIRLGS